MKVSGLSMYNIYSKDESDMCIPIYIHVLQSTATLLASSYGYGPFNVTIIMSKDLNVLLLHTVGTTCSKVKKSKRKMEKEL